MTLDKLVGWKRELLMDARVARLGFVDPEGRPRVQPVTFALWSGEIWSAVDRKQKRDLSRELARIRYLRRSPHAAFLVDHYEEDWTRLAWIQVLGEVDIVNIDEAPAASAALTRKYPQYRLAPPQGPLMRLKPGRVVAWKGS